MKALIIDAVSSAIRYQVLDYGSEDVLLKGRVGKIGSSAGKASYSSQGDEEEQLNRVRDHNEAIELALNGILKTKAISSLHEIGLVGHRVVHGGERFSRAALIKNDVLRAIEELIDLAPSHNPYNLAGINACMKRIPDAEHYAVFDTAFHATLPKSAFLYGLPYQMYTNYGLRKYGFHGTSHKYAATEAARLLKREFSKLKIISCFFGAGVSICAIRNGQSVETSTGLSPTDGLMMGTRSSSFDPEIIPFLVRRKGYSIEEVEEMMKIRSGLMQISDFASDLYKQLEKELTGSVHARLALDTLVYRIQRYIGSFATVLNGFDTLIFTGEIGWQAHDLRRMICRNLEFLGLKLDPSANEANETIITSDESEIQALAIPPNDELQILREIKEVVQS